jgi:L-lactate utilization protein LutB
MRTLAEQRYSKLGPKVVKALTGRFFEAYYFDEVQEAADKIFSLISKEHVVSWGGSVTLTTLGIQERLSREGYNLLDRDKGTTREESNEIMRRALLCDTYLTGTNAISEDGRLINIDGNGNRVAALIFGPKQVIVTAGMNKIAKTYEDAFVRARNVAAPLNIRRFPDKKTPCNEDGSCADCHSSDTICAHFVTTRLCKPAGRIKVILIGKDLGF